MTNIQAPVPGVCPVHLPFHAPTHQPSDTLTGACTQIHVCFPRARAQILHPTLLALPMSSLSLGSRWWGVRLVAHPLPTPSHQPITPYFFYPREHHPTPLCAVEEPECWKASPSLPPSCPQNPWLAAIGGTQSGVLKLQLVEETLDNLPIACHRPWPGLFVSGTPLISPSTPSSVFPPSLPTQFLYPKTVSSFLKYHPFFLSGCVVTIFFLGQIQ